MVARRRRAKDDTVLAFRLDTHKTVCESRKVEGFPEIEIRRHIDRTAGTSFDQVFVQGTDERFNNVASAVAAVLKMRKRNGRNIRTKRRRRRTS